jgi:phosphoribosyl 1,2-cyclic phosphodiesterase
MSKIKFWGVRGSIPTPGPTTVRYGGNTACVELRHEDKLFILDAGSGIRLFGVELLKKKTPIKASIFISHMHWDHIQGIPFFTPAFIPGNMFTIYGAEEVDKELETIIAGQMDPTYFPVELEEMNAKIEFKRLYEGSYEIDGIRVDTLYINHPGNALGYKFHLDDKNVVYISDNEPFAGASYSGSYDKEYSEDILIGENSSEKLIDFIKGASLLIHDAQYTPEEYKSHVTWGHSPYDYTVNLGLQAKVNRLALFHHDPLHNDDFIDSMLEEARKLARRAKSNMEITAAQEGMVIEL